MTNRERITLTALCKPVDRLPLTFYFGPWTETVPEWEKQGFPHGQPWDYGLGLDAGIRHVDVNLGYCPAFPYEILEDKGEKRIVRDELGIVMEVYKEHSTIPRYLDYPVKGWEDWEKQKKERLNPDSPERFPDNWESLAEEYNNGDYVIQLGWYPYGLFGTLRDMMGVENLLIMFYDDPDLIHAMMDGLTDFWLAIYEKVCRTVKVDAIHMWEDMSGKGGALISPAMIREFMMPNYKRMKAFADAHDIPMFSLDTDGDCTQLVPLFLESGINTILPFEVACGSDVVKYRELYPDLCIYGGIDKREIAKGKLAIDRELDRIDKMFDYPGYIAALDHLIPPDITRGDFEYFVQELRKRIIQHASHQS